MPALPDANALATMPLFKGLTTKELSQLNELLRVKTFPAGATLFTEGQPGEAVYIIISGTIKLHAEQADGRDVFIDLSGAGDVVGEMSIIENTGRTLSALTLEESTCLWLDRSSFLESLQAIPTLLRNLVVILSGRLRMANERIQAFASQDVDGRVARHILAFARKYGRPDAQGHIVIPIRLTQSELAELAGASRVRVNQVINSYKQRAFISVDQNFHITVHDSAALARRFQ